MKPFFTFLCLFLAASCFAQQRITIIDKSSETAFLFDENNSQSLVSLLNNNPLPFTPMKQAKAGKLMKLGYLQDTPVLYGPQSDIALTTQDGEDSLAVINGVLQFMYPMPEIFHTDLQDISRLLLYEHMVESNGKQQFVIDSIGYAKKYNATDKFDLVGTIPYEVLDKEYELFYVEQAPITTFQSLIYDGLWSQLRSNQLHEDLINTKPILNWNSLMSANYYAFTFDVLQENRPKHKKWSKRDYHWPIQTDTLELFAKFSELEARYGEGKIHGMKEKESDIPLTNIDGEDSTIIDGNLFFVYPEPAFHISWIDIQPTKAWFIYSVSSETLTPKNILRRIVFTKGDNNSLLADFDCLDHRSAELYNKLLVDAGVKFEVPVSENWKTALLKARLKGKHYSLNDNRDLKKLKSEFEEVEDLVK